MKAVLRNTSFTKSLFTKLKFNLQPEPYKIQAEGYQHRNVMIDHELKNVCYYDQKLHQLYKKYYANQHYQHVDVFKTYFGHYEIYCVNFDQSIIQSSQIKDDLHKVNFSDTTIEDVHFSTNFIKSSFNNTIFKHCVFSICLFNQCQFKNVIFENCQIHFSHMKHCHLNTTFTNTPFKNTSFSYCHLDTTFTRCTYDNVYQHGCTTNKHDIHSLSTSFTCSLSDHDFNKMRE